MARRIGIMGGTFNPVHLGHLRAAEEVFEMLRLDAFFFVPSAVPPHKGDAAVASFDHRIEMLRRAIEGHPVFRLSDLERRLPGKSYTVMSLQKFREETPDGAELFFIMGMDAFLELDQWWNYRKLFQLARIVVLRRPGYPGEDLAGSLNRRIATGYAWDGDAGCYLHPELLPVYYPGNTNIGISSTQIRALAAEGRSIRYLAPGRVVDYIEETGIYRENVHTKEKMIEWRESGRKRPE